MRSVRHWLSQLAGLVALSCLAVSGVASAQSTTAEGDAEARAQALFAEAWRLMDQQRPADACVMFRRALELKRSPSILNNVGRCLQQENDLLGAIATFESSVALAEEQPPSAKRDTWLDGARRELAALQPRVARLELSWPATPALSVSIDGKAVTPGLSHLYLLPGRHRLQLSAPGHLPFESELLAVAGGSEQQALPALQPIPVSEPPSSTAPPEPARSTVQLPARAFPDQSAAPAGEARARVWPWALAGTGSALVLAGVATGLSASAKSRELEQNCPGGICPGSNVEPGWQDKIDDTRRMALVTDVLWGVGLATLGVGVTLLVLDGDGEGSAQHAELQASCRGGRCGLGLTGRF